MSASDASPQPLKQRAIPRRGMITPLAGSNSGCADGSKAGDEIRVLAANASAKTRCAAQAEYGRLAAQAYSPSDAMSQAGICLDGLEKVQRRSLVNLAGPVPAAETAA